MYWSGKYERGLEKKSIQQGVEGGGMYGAVWWGIFHGDCEGTIIQKGNLTRILTLMFPCSHWPSFKDIQHKNSQIKFHIWYTVKIQSLCEAVEMKWFNVEVSCGYGVRLTHPSNQWKMGFSLLIDGMIWTWYVYYNVKSHRSMCDYWRAPSRH